MSHVANFTVAWEPTVKTTEFFDKKLDCPLTNPLRSWGAKSLDVPRSKRELTAYQCSDGDGRSFWM